MTTLLNVTEIKYLEKNKILRIRHDKTATPEEEFSVDGTGQKFRTYKEDDVWKVDIESGVITKEHTEIRTIVENTKITFEDFNAVSGKTTLMKFIGIQDIRDGTRNAEMEIAFGLTPVSIQTTGTQLSIKKEHQ